MTERRTHWDDDLIESVGSILPVRYDVEGVPMNPDYGDVYTVVAAVEDWHKAKRDQRVRTHSEQCWRWHQECAEHLIEHLQERMTQLQHQRDALREDNTRLLRANRTLAKTMGRVQALADSWSSWIQRSSEMGFTPTTVGEMHFALTRALRGKKVRHADTPTG